MCASSFLQWLLKSNSSHKRTEKQILSAFSGVRAAQTILSSPLSSLASGLGCEESRWEIGTYWFVISMAQHFSHGSTFLSCPHWPRSMQKGFLSKASLSFDCQSHSFVANTLPHTEQSTTKRPHAAFPTMGRVGTASTE